MYLFVYEQDIEAKMYIYDKVIANGGEMRFQNRQLQSADL